MTSFFRIFFVVLFVLTAPAQAAQTTQKSQTAQKSMTTTTGTVTRVIDSQTFEMKDGTIVRLQGIETPYVSYSNPEFAPWPFAAETKQKLDEMLLGKDISIVYTKGNIDRYERLLAQAHLNDEAHTWIQGELLKLGYARVQTYNHTRDFAADMLALETQARAENKGIWSDPFYAILPAQQALTKADSFQLVDGYVWSSTNRGKDVQLFFGGTPTKDFHVIIPEASLRLFTEARIDVTRLTGQRLLVRGWIQAEKTGDRGQFTVPAIRVTHPEQIQFLGKK